MPGLSAAIASVLAALCVIAAAGDAEAADVLMGRVDSRGSGANLSETTLDTTTVSPTRFGKLFSYEVDGFVYAQPLVVSGLAIRGATRNVVYIATTTGMVYALDADRPGVGGGLLWSRRLVSQGETAAPPTPQTDRTVRGSVGILGTPVIDRGRRALYVISRTAGPIGYKQRLYALDLVTGHDKRRPADIVASAQGDGFTFTFNPEIQQNRPGLAMSGSSVVIAWNGPEGDHGWVMAFDADTLERTGVFCTTCAAREEPIRCECPTCTGPRVPWLLGGGIWQAGRPPVVDTGGHVYYFVGNGWVLGHLDERNQCCPGPERKPPTGYHGESLVKLAPPSLQLRSSWTPTSWCALDRCDFDLSGSGPMLIDFRFSGGDTRTFVVGGGKEGRLYTIDTRDIPAVAGHGTMALKEEFLVAGAPSSCSGGVAHHLMSGPVFWPRSADGRPSVFVSVENDRVRGYALASQSTPSGSMTPIVNPLPRTMTSTVISGHPGAILALSADRDRPGTGILWMTYAVDNPAAHGATLDTRRGRVAAYDADDLGRELWNSDMAEGARDALGHFAKFTPPTIVNGKVYVPAFASPEPYRPTNAEPGHTAHGRNIRGYVVVYGPNPPPKAPLRSFSGDLIPSLLSPLLQ